MLADRQAGRVEVAHPFAPVPANARRVIQIDRDVGQCHAPEDKSECAELVFHAIAVGPVRLAFAAVEYLAARAMALLLQVAHPPHFPPVRGIPPRVITFRGLESCRCTRSPYPGRRWARCGCSTSMASWAEISRVWINAITRMISSSVRQSCTTSCAAIEIAAVDGGIAAPQLGVGQIGQHRPIVNAEQRHEQKDFRSRRPGRQ